MADIKIKKNLPEPDPRIKKIRRRRKAIVISGVSAILLIIVFSLVYGLLFRIKNFSVKYKEAVPYTEKEIAGALSSFEGKNLFRVSSEKISRELERKMPYIDSVKVARKLPWTLVLTVDKSDEVFAVELNKGIYAITNGRLKVLEINTEVPKGAILVQGRTTSDYEVGSELRFSAKVGDDSIQKALIEIADTTVSDEITDITMVDIGNINGIYAIYDNRIIIHLGDTLNMSSKISLSKKAIDEENKISPKGYGELNVTVSKKAVFAPKDYKDIDLLIQYNEKMEGLTEEAEENAQTDEDSSKNEEESLVSEENQ